MIWSNSPPPTAYLGDSRRPYTSRRTSSDVTVVIQPQDHPYVRHETVVAYGFARLAKVDTLMSLIKGGTGSFHDDVSAELLEKMQSGLIDSPRTA